MLKRRRAVAIGALILVALPLAAMAQRRGYFEFEGRFGQYENVPYDGRFTFARIRYEAYGGWRADYPTMERNLMPMVQDITTIRPHTDGSNVHTFDDPMLLRYPTAYVSEPGYWFPNDAEVLGLRNYFKKGGFVIFDDFHFDPEWNVFAAAINRVLPGVQIHRLDIKHPIFNSFFQIKTLDVPYPGRLGEQGLMGEFYGIYQDNDTTKPLIAVINYNIDIGDYVEWSAQDIYAFLPTNEAYKFFVNYIVYGFTH